MHFDQQLYTLVKAAIKEDVGDGDHSSLSCIPADARGMLYEKRKQRREERMREQVIIFKFHSNFKQSKEKQAREEEERKQNREQERNRLI